MLLLILEEDGKLKVLEIKEQLQLLALKGKQLILLEKLPIIKVQKCSFTAEMAKYVNGILMAQIHFRQGVKKGASRDFPVCPSALVIGT